MIAEKYLNLLDALGAGSYPHSQRTLKDHLIGTYTLLLEWGNPEYIALGGLFHSIYGTQVYRISAASLQNRPRIIEVMGEKAENLAYLFCVTDRQGFVYEVEKNEPVLWDCVQARLVRTTCQTMQDLLEIEVANDLEQRDLSVNMKPRYLSRRQHTLSRCKAFISPSAQAALARSIEETRTAKLQQYSNSHGAVRKTISFKLMQS